ncbi:MAG: ABC transporter ATP-binding protein [Dehalococcoidia bacterium]
MTPLLAVSNVVAGYGETEILHGVSLRLAPGEIITIIGPNGSGKSTLLKAIYGLVKPVGGTVQFRGQDITGTPPEQMVRRGLSYVPQANNVFASLTVRENLEMGAFIRKSGLTERLAEMHALFPELATRRDQRAGNLSGGQRQMLAFARAMMLDPQLLLLDEPSAGLSPAMTELVFDKIGHIHEAGVSVIIVEQRARQALTISSRGYLLTNGENRLEDDAQQLLNDPQVARLYLGG